MCIWYENNHYYLMVNCLNNPPNNQWRVLLDIPSYFYWSTPNAYKYLNRSQTITDLDTTSVKAISLMFASQHPDEI